MSDDRENNRKILINLINHCDLVEDDSDGMARVKKLLSTEQLNALDYLLNREQSLTEKIKKGV